MAVATKPTTKQFNWQERGQWIARALGLQPADLATFCDDRIRSAQVAAASPAASPAAAGNAPKKRSRKPAMATA